jgi:hypothetical protein
MEKPIIIKTTHMAVLTVVVMGLAAIFYKPIFSYDVWLHLKMGEYIVQHDYQLPKTDPFSSAMDNKPLIHHEWLSQIILYRIHQIFGFSGIRIMRAALLLTALAYIFKASLRFTGRFPIALFTLLALAYLFRTRYLARPELFSILFFTALYYRLAVSEKPFARPTYIFIFFIFVLWINLHPFMLFFGAVISISFADQIAGRIPWTHRFFQASSPAYNPALLLLLFLTASLINPHGYGIYEYVFQATPLVERYIREWQSVFVGLQSSYFKAITGGVLAFPLIMKSLVIGILGLFLIVLVGSYIRRLKWSLEDILLGLLLGYMAVKAARFVWLLFIPLLLSVKYGTLLAEREGWWARYRHIGTPLLQVGLAVALLYWAGQGYKRIPNNLRNEIESHRYPVVPVKIIHEANLSGRIYNPSGWGGYLIYHLYPSCKPFIDTRSYLHGQKRLIEAIMIQYQYPWYKKLINKHGFDILLMQKMYGDKLPFTSPKWILLFEDRRCAMYLRKDDQNVQNLNQVVDYFQKAGISFNPEYGYERTIR